MPWKPPTATEYYIGIDAGVSTGLAVWDKKKQVFEHIATLMIHRAMEHVLKLHADHTIRVIVEDARLSRKPPKTKEDYAKAMSKIKGVGSVCRDASIWEDFLTDHKIPHEMKAPNYRLTKWDKETFAKATKYTGLTSSHSRDAALIVYGK